jgi:cation transport regulator ChaC
VKFCCSMETTELDNIKEREKLTAAATTSAGRQSQYINKTENHLSLYPRGRAGSQLKDYMKIDHNTQNRKVVLIHNKCRIE